MSRKRKIIFVAVVVSLLVLLGIGLLLAFRPEEKEKPERGVIRDATTKVIESDTENAGFDIKEGDIHYSHGSIVEGHRYPGWEGIQIDKDGKEEKMKQIGDKLFVTTDKEKKAFFASDSSSNTSDTHDMAYVFKAPRKVKLDIVLNVKVSASGGDGVVAYAYRNDTDHCVINGTIVTGKAALEAKDVILEKGDRLYFRYNRNKTTDSDTGNFYAKVIFNELDPEEEVSRGEKFKISEAVVPMPTPGTNSFSHGSIKYPDAYPFWSAVAISRTTKKETALVKEEDKLYIAGDTTKRAFFGSDTSAHPSETYDMAYVYTMPCKAKINLVLNAKVTADGGDGVVGSVYVNNKSNMIIQETVIQSADGAKAIPANNLVLNKGDKIYFVYSMHQSIQNDAGNFYGKISYVEIDPKDDGSNGGGAEDNQTDVVQPGTISYSHGSLNNAKVYPYWNTKSVELASGKISDMVKGSEAKTVYVEKDKTAYLNSSGKAQSSSGHDLLYVYTMPVKAKVNIALNASVKSAGSDGVVVYAYRNSTDNCIINHTEVTNTGNRVVGQKDGIILNKGDQIYFRLNAKGTSNEDEGWFYAKITYAEIEPSGDAFVGEAYKETTQGGESDSDEAQVSKGTITYGNHSIQYPDLYRNWSTVSISDSKETAMIRDGEKVYVTGDTSKEPYFASNGMAKAAEHQDLAYVYTMPVKAKVDIELMTMLTDTSKDGIAVTVYADEPDNPVIADTQVTNKEGLKILSADDIILDKGSKLYFRLNKNQSSDGDEGLFQAKITFIEINPAGNAYKQITWKDMVVGGTMSGGSYGTYYSHGSINNPTVYPYFATMSIDLKDGRESALVTGSAANTMYVKTDSSAYLNTSGRAQSSAEHDLAYVYTMPCKAKINIALNASVSGKNSDGIVVYAYANNTSNCIINRTVVTKTSNTTVGVVNGITLDKGDKIYFRLNKKDTITEDAGYFYARITYVNEEPDQDVFKGEELEVEEVLTWEDLVAGKGTNNGASFSHGSIASPNTYAYWETKSISHATGEEKALVKGSVANYMYIDGDATAYLNSSGKAQPAANHDLVYVYTMPCRARIDIALNASVADTKGDGVVVYAYVNDVSNCVIDRIYVKNTSNKTVGNVTDITLNKGDKIYFRLNKNENRTGDAGYFYAKITYRNQAPDQVVYVESAYDQLFSRNRKSFFLAKLLKV